MNKKYVHLLIWDYPDEEVIKSENTDLVLWRSFSSNRNIVSIPRLVDEWSDSIREEYLAWIFYLGNYKIGEKSIKESLLIFNSISAWWLGLIVEKSNFSKSIYINDIIRLLTFKKWLKNKKISKITLYTSNTKLKNTFKRFCLKRKFLFESKTFKKNLKLNLGFKKTFFLLPFFLRGIIWFIYKIIYNFPLIIKKVGYWKNNQKQYIFVSYLFNMINSDKKNFLFSTYWGELPKKLKQNKTYTYWLHLYVKDKYLKNPYQASKLIDKLNKNNSLQKHITIYSFMNLKVIYKIFTDWIRMQKNIHKIALHKSFPIYKDFDFWEFYKDDWYDSFLGITCIDNLIYLNLFQEAFKSCNRFSAITYLLENQGWEIAMLSVCKSLNINKTIGFSHAASRYWDLRNFYDKREFIDKNNLSLPRPKILAVNSNFALNQFLSFGYPRNQIKLVEALRHSYLGKHNIKRINNSNNKKSLLVLGDYENINTKNQLSILNKLPLNILKNLEIIYKPHPASTLNINVFSSLSMSLREESISKLLPLSNLVYCGTVTSASVDAFAFGSKVIIYNDPKILNLSPLRNFKDVTFIMNSIQLEEAIVNFISGKIYTASQRAIFELSEELPLWKNLLFKTIKN